MKIITVHSLRGGAGRTTLALKKAREAGPSAVLVETDLLGSSLVDVLPLRAPGFDLGPEAPIDLRQCPSDWLSVEETRARMESRHRHALGGQSGSNCPQGVPFLNDYLIHTSETWDPRDEADARALLWIEEKGGPRIIPASPLPQDQLVAEVLLSSELRAGFVENRLELLIAALLGAGVSTIVLDSGRGLRGFASSVLSLALRLAHKRPLSEGGRLPRILEDTPLEVEVLLLCAKDRAAIDRWLRYCPEEDRALIQIVERPDPSAPTPEVDHV